MIRFVAQRLSGKDMGQVSRPAILIATAGVAIGLCIMIMTLCITGGFKMQVHNQVRSVGGDMHITNTGSLYESEGASLPISDSIMAAIRAFDGIDRAERVVNKVGCLKTDSAFTGIVLCGMESDTTLADNEIVISTTQAAQMGLDMGDKVMAYFFDDNIRARRFTIVGTYATYFNDIDDVQVFASYATVHALTGYDEGECNYVRIFDGATTDDSSDLPRSLQLLQYVRTLIPTTPTCQSTVMTLEEMHPQVFSWLELLDMNVVIIIVLMLCVSGFTMASGLFILILERTQMIGLMKALGARFATLRHIFLYLAGIILIRGMLLGNLLAIGLAFVQYQWHVIKLNPVYYYIDAVPIVFPWIEILALNVGTLLVTIAVLIIPTWIIGKISPVKALKFD